MPHFFLEPSHWCWHDDHGEGEVLARLPNDKLIVCFQRWDFPDGSIVESSIKTVAANSPRITPYDGGERHLPTAIWLLTEQEKASLTTIARGEWIVCHFQGFGIVETSCNDNWHVVYIDMRGDRRQHPAWETNLTATPVECPVCWIALPSAEDKAQSPPPSTAVFAQFNKSAQEWVGIVTDCEEGFIEQHDYVDHLIYCREVIAEQISANPALMQHPAWQDVAAADALFRRKNTTPLAAIEAQYPHWWQQVGWSIFARVNNLVADAQDTPTKAHIESDAGLDAPKRKVAGRGMND